MPFNDPGLARNTRPLLVRLRSHVFLFAIFLLSLFVLATGSAVFAQPPSSPPTTTTECDWTILTTVNTHVYNAFHGVAPISSDDVWAVGSSGNGNFGQLTLIEHWDGAAWTVVPSPNPGTNANELEDVVAVSSNNVWAVGYYTASGNSSLSVILHWDGTSWTQVASPSPASFLNDLYDIDAVSANNIWAVGYSWNAGSAHSTLIMHWDGTSWNIIPSPNANQFQNHLASVSALSANDVWAAGSYIHSSGKWQTLVMHWDGTAWTILPTPNLLLENNYLQSISVLSTNDIWAAGYSCVNNCSGFGGERTFTMHWNGTDWSIIPTPDLGEDYAYFNSVTVTAPNSAWAVGVYTVGSNSYNLAEHWDGTTWTQVQVPSPEPHTCCPLLMDIVSLPSGELWIAGDYHFPGSQVLRTRVMHLTVSCGPTTPTPTPLLLTPTSTPTSPIATPTATTTRTPTLTPAPTSPSATTTLTPTQPSPTSEATSTVQLPSPSPTATVCLIEFSDVPPGSTFYPYVMCLACHAILGGYPDNTFRPSNSLTRGQLAKIVSNAADLQGSPTGQTFEDVPPGATFYIFIERVAASGIINGYPCGTNPNEPCGNGNLPYFRPSANATRGQVAKIVSDAAGFSDFPPAQLMEDVPTTHTFYLLVQRLATRSIMSGYSCGGPGEPCISPNNRPYFRPAATTTRGQTSKIISSTFFPSCAEQQRP